MMKSAVDVFVETYPKVFRACHVRHVRDAKTKRVLSAHQASILSHLDGREPMQLHALTRHMGVTASTMSLNIDRLARAGFVRRERHAMDKRRTNLLLTEAGMRIKQQHKVLDPERVADLLGQLSAIERAEVIRAMRVLGAAAAQLQERGS